MNTTLDPRTAETVRMANEVIAQHFDEKHCSADEPCWIVEMWGVELEKVNAGYRESQFTAEREFNGHRPAAGAKAGNQFGTFQVKYATDRQVAYIGRLLAKRDRSSLGALALDLVEKADEAFHTGKISRRLASDALDILVPLDDRASLASEAPKAPEAKVDTRRPNRYAGKCTECGGWVEAEAGYLTKDAAGKWAAEHKDGEHKAAATTAAPAAEIEVGVYDLGGRIFRAYYGRQSGNILCKEVVKVGLYENGKDEYELQYRGMASRFLGGARKMSLEEAKTWGKTTESCCVCGAHLDDPKSIDAGIGPVCGAKFQ